MKVEVLANAREVAKKAAKVIALEASAAVAARGRFVMAVSGGHTPWLMLRELADEAMPCGRRVRGPDERGPKRPANRQPVEAVRHSSRRRRPDLSFPPACRRFVRVPAARARLSFHADA